MKKFTSTIFKVSLPALCALCSLGVQAETGTLLRTIEAEAYDTTSFAGVLNKESVWASNGMYVENISPSQFLQYNNISVPAAGTYKLKVFYYNRDKAGRNISAWTNQQVRGSVFAPDTTGQWNGGPFYNTVITDPTTDPVTTRNDTVWGTEGSKTVDMFLYFRAGNNKLLVGGTPGSTLASGYCPNLDKLELYSTDTVIAIPEDVPNSFEWDYTNDAVIASDKPYNGLSGLTDNNDKTFFEVNPQGTAAITFAFQNKMYINGCLFYLGEDAVFNPDIWDVQYSEDSVNWMSSTRTAKAARGEGKVFMLSTAAVKYIRLVITANETVRIAEFQLFGFPRINEKPDVQYPDDMTGRITLDPDKGTFSADDPGLTSYNEIAQNAIDGVQNKYTVNGKKIGLAYEFNEAQSVGSYSLAIGSNTNMSRNPKSWVLKGADYDLAFVTLDSVSNFVFPQVDYNCMKFNVDVPGDYVYYRLDITNNGDAMSHISEWQLFPAQLVPPTPVSVKNPIVSNDLAKVYGRNAGIELNKITSDAANYQVVDMLGKVVKQGALLESQTIVAPQGVYVVRVNSSNLIQTIKVLVK